MLEGFQTFGPPQGCNHGDGHPHPQAHLSSALQGLNFGLTCLAQLTAPQFALVQNDSATLPANGGRIILVTALSRYRRWHQATVTCHCAAVMCFCNPFQPR